MEKLIEAIPFLESPSFKFIGFFIVVLLFLFLGVLNATQKDRSNDFIRFLKFMIYIFSTIWVFAFFLGLYHGNSQPGENSKEKEATENSQDSTSEAVTPSVPIPTVKTPTLDTVKFYGVIVDKADLLGLSDATISHEGKILSTTSSNGTYEFTLSFPIGHREMIVFDVFKADYASGNFSFSSQGGYNRILLSLKSK